MSDVPHDRLDRALDDLLAGAAPVASEDGALVQQAAYLHALYAPLPMQVEARAALKARLLALHTTTTMPHMLVPTLLPRRPRLWQRPVALRLGLAAACLLITVGLSLAANNPRGQNQQPNVAVGAIATATTAPTLSIATATAHGVLSTPLPSATPSSANATPAVVPTRRPTAAPQGSVIHSSPTPLTPAPAFSATAEPMATTASSATAESLPTATIRLPTATATLPVQAVGTAASSATPALATSSADSTALASATAVPASATSPAVLVATATVVSGLPASPTSSAVPTSVPSATPSPTHDMSPAVATPHRVTAVPLPTDRPSATPAPTRVAVVAPSPTLPAPARPTDTPTPPDPTSTVAPISRPTQPPAPSPTLAPPATATVAVPSIPIPSATALPSATLPAETPTATADHKIVPIAMTPVPVASATVAPDQPTATSAAPPSSTATVLIAPSATAAPAQPTPIVAAVEPAVSPTPHLASVVITSTRVPATAPVALLPVPAPANAVLQSPLQVALPMPLGADVLPAAALPARVPSLAVPEVSVRPVSTDAVRRLAGRMGLILDPEAQVALNSVAPFSNSTTVAGVLDDASYLMTVESSLGGPAVSLEIIARAATVTATAQAGSTSDAAVVTQALLTRLRLWHDNLYLKTISAPDATTGALTITFGQLVGVLPLVNYDAVTVRLGVDGRLLGLRYRYVETDGSQSYPTRGPLQALVDLRRGASLYVGPTLPPSPALLVSNVSLAYVGVQGTDPATVHLEPVYVISGTVPTGDGGIAFTAYDSALAKSVYER